MSKKFLFFYLLLLGVTIGVEVALGALTAPVIFFDEKILPQDVLTHFQSGQLMTVIFLRYSYALAFVLLVIAAAEIWQILTKQTTKLSVAFAALNLTFGAAFIYFARLIAGIQSKGEAFTATDHFALLHRLSELDMKLLMLAQLALLTAKFIHIPIKGK